MRQVFKQLLENFQEDLNKIEHLKVVDIVLYGSTISGDYIEGRGDIDFLVFIEDEITTIQKEALFKLHESYRVNFDKYAQLEGTYYHFNNNKELVNGVYIGTKRKGWKVVDSIIHGPVEQGMILNNYKTLNRRIRLEEYFETNWTNILEEVISTTKEFERLKNELNNVEFNIYAIQTTTRNIYTRDKRNFTSKSHGIDYVIALGKYDAYKALLEDLKVLRYPYLIEEINRIDVNDTNQLLSELINELI